MFRTDMNEINIHPIDPEREDKGHVRLDFAVSSIIFRAMSVTSELRRRVRTKRSLSRYEPCLPSVRPNIRRQAVAGSTKLNTMASALSLSEKRIVCVFITRNGHDFSGGFPLIVGRLRSER